MLIANNYPIDKELEVNGFRNVYWNTHTLAAFLQHRHGFEKSFFERLGVRFAVLYSWIRFLFPDAPWLY